MAPVYPIKQKKGAKEKKRMKKITASKIRISPYVSAIIDIITCASSDSEESLYNDKNEERNTGVSASFSETSDASNFNEDKAVLSDTKTELESVPESLNKFRQVQNRTR